MGKLTQKEFEDRVYQSVGDQYSVAGEYQGKTKPVLMHCNIHDVDFSTIADNFMRGKDDVRASCPYCKEDKRNERFNTSREIVKCEYCGIPFIKSKSTLSNSRSGLYFCCREHKDLAQRMTSGEKFNELRPAHYGEAYSDYRLSAFRKYPHECAVCGYHDYDDTSLLDVHHIDSDRSNNDIENLIILCPNCHRKLTSQKYTLVDRKEIVPKLQ